MNVVSPGSQITSKIYFKDVKFNSNAGVAGLRLPLSGHSEVTMENVEASYNVGDTPDPDYDVAYGALFLFIAIPGPEDHVARVIFKGKNSFNNNAGTGLELQMAGVDSEIVVSKKSQLNVDENGYNGLSLVQFEEGLTTKFLVEKGGAVNACGNLPERPFLESHYMIFMLVVGAKLSGSVTSLAIGKIMALTASHALVVMMMPNMLCILFFEI